MINEFSKKNNVLTLAFLIAELSPIEKTVLDYAQKRKPIELLDVIINKSTQELRSYLRDIQREMDRNGVKSVNINLYV